MSKLQNETYLVKILDLIREDIEHNQRGEFFQKFYDLKNQNYPKVSAETVRVFKGILKAAIRKFQTDPSMNNVLSSIISLTPNIIPVESFDKELDGVLQQCLNLTDARTKANALNALAEYNPESDVFKKHFNSNSNRIAADALIIEGKKQITPEIEKHIEQFLNSFNPYFMASGIYIVAILAEHYKKTDPTVIDKSLKKFFQKIEVYSQHPHEMVRKRALQSLPALRPTKKDAA